MKVIEIFSVEASEDDHAAADETSTMSSSGSRVVADVAAHFEAFKGVRVDVNDQDVVEVAAEPACEDVYLSIEDCC